MYVNTLLEQKVKYIAKNNELCIAFILLTNTNENQLCIHLRRSLSLCPFLCSSCLLVQLFGKHQCEL